MTRRDLLGLYLLGLLLGVASVLLSVRVRSEVEPGELVSDVVAELFGDAAGDRAGEALRRTTGHGKVPGAASAEAPLRVLFLGNSYTVQSGMARLVAQLAAAAGVRPFEAVVDAPSGAGFREHVASGRYAQHLKTHRFDYVVLQEQSQRPSFHAKQRATLTVAPARTLGAAAAEHGARTLLFQTWARSKGDPDNEPNDTYDAMQDRVIAGYDELAQQLGARVAPVGAVWREVHEREPSIALWKPDGSHPAPAGGYLASCVMFRAIYDRPVSDVAFYAALDPNDARRIQQLVDAHYGERPEPGEPSVASVPAALREPVPAVDSHQGPPRVVVGIVMAPAAGCASGYDTHGDVCYHRHLDRDPAVRARAIAAYRAGAAPPEVLLAGDGAQ